MCFVQNVFCAVAPQDICVARDESHFENGFAYWQKSRPYESNRFIRTLYLTLYLHLVRCLYCKGTRENRPFF